MRQAVLMTAAAVCEETAWDWPACTPASTINIPQHHQQQLLHSLMHLIQSCVHSERSRFHPIKNPVSCFLIVLQVGIYQVLYLNRTPEDAYAPLAPKGPYMPFRDASCGIPTFNLQPIDCIRVRADHQEQPAPAAVLA
jgi:hypothetical protein